MPWTNKVSTAREDQCLPLLSNSKPIQKILVKNRKRIDHMQFTASALDMKVGTEFGAISWGYQYDETKEIYTEETPQLQDAKSDRMQGRDRAVGVWNKDVAQGDIDKVPVSE